MLKLENNKPLSPKDDGQPSVIKSCWQRVVSLLKGEKKTEGILPLNKSDQKEAHPTKRLGFWQQLHDATDAPSALQRWTLWSCSAFLTLSLLWMSFSQIDEVVRGTGRLIPAGQARVIQHLEGGILSEIMVREGERVKPQQPLFRVTSQEASSQLRSTDIKLLSLHLKVARLNAEEKGLDHFEPPALGKNQKNYPKDLFSTEEKLFQQRRKAIEDQISIAQEQLNQKTLRVAELYSQVSNIEAELNVAKKQRSMAQKLKDVGAGSTAKILNTEAQLSNLTTKLESTRQSIPVIEAEMAEVRSRIDEITSGHRTDILRELTETLIEIETTEEQRQALKDRVERTEILAPVKGIVSKVYLFTLGGVVRPSNPLAEIIPLDEQLLVEAKINTKDRAKIWPGQRVSINITAFSDARSGSLNGTLESISADSFYDEALRGYCYTTKTIINKQDNRSYIENIAPGMVADINILVGKRSILSFLWRPVRSLIDNTFKE
jgi:adhesin transport system membrane fusion protein